MRNILLLFVATACWFAASVEAASYYEILGVDEDASDRDIKRAYRKLSLQYHPDKNPGDQEAASKYSEINKAYEVLSDSGKRILYDSGGEEAVEEGSREAPPNPFDMLFGGGGRKRRNAKQGPDAHVDVEVALEDFYNGGEVSARIQRMIVCRGCADKPRQGKCATCQSCPPETRMVQRQMGNMIVQMQEEVPSKERCKNEAKTLTATVERGMTDGSEVRFAHESEQRPGMIPGDVIFRLQAKQHPRFRRQGDDLHMTINLSLRESLIGFKRSIPHLDGHTVDIEYEGITKPGQVRTIANEGMPVHEFPSQKGNLVVTYKIRFPKTLTDAQKAAIEDNF